MNLPDDAAAEPVSSTPATTATSGLDRFLRATLAAENPPPAGDSTRAQNLRPNSAAPDATPPDPHAARLEADLAVLARSHRTELSRLETRLAAAERTARELASQLQELR